SDAAGRLVQYARVPEAAEILKRVIALAPFSREEAKKSKAVAVERRTYERGEHSGRARNRNHGNTSLRGGAHQARTRIRHERRAPIGDQRDVASITETSDGGCRCTRLVVLMIRKHRGRYRMVIEQVPRVASVFRENQVHGAEHIDRAKHDVAQVADRCADD